jgi:hypothetical protein
MRIVTWSLLRFSLGLIALVLLAQYPRTTFAQPPAASIKPGEPNVWGLVANDVAAIIEFPNPRASWSTILGSQPAKRFFDSPLRKDARLVTARRQLGQLNDAIAQQTGTLLSEQLLDAFDQQLVLAIYSPPNKEAEGVVLGATSDAKSLTRIINTWKALDKSSSFKSTSYRSAEILERTGPTTIYCVSLGQRFALTDKLSRARQVAELAEQQATGTTPNAYRLQPPRFSNADRALVRAKVYSRRWDHLLDPNPSGDPGEILLREAWLLYEEWQITVDWDTGPIIRLAGIVPTAEVARSWHQGWLANTKLPSALSRVPAEAALVLAGRWNLPAVVKLFLERSPKQDLDEFEKGRRLLRGATGGEDPLDRIAPAITGDWTMWLAPAPLSGGKRWPAKIVFDSLSPPTDQPNPSLTRAIDAYAQFAMQAFSAMWNDDPNRPEATVMTKVVTSDSRAKGSEGQGIVRTLTALRQDIVAVFASDKQLTWAGDEETLQQYLAAEAPPRSPANGPLHAVLNLLDPEASQLAVVNIKATRTWLVDQRALLTAWGKTQLRLGPQFDEKFNLLAESLELADWLALTASITPDRFQLSLGLICDP